MKIKSNRVYYEEKFQPATITIENGIIKSVTKGLQDDVDKDYGDLRITPGFVDIHCHGFRGFDMNFATYEGFKNWVEYLPNNDGVTTFLATSSTAPEKNLLESFALISKAIDDNLKGAHCRGIHVEGPQISFAYKGAQNPYQILKPDVDQFKHWQEVANGKIVMICIAPEMDEDHKLIKYCVSNGVKVAIGHTGATYEECVSAVKDGADSFTHTYNGMAGLHHRKPNVVGAALSLDEAYAEIICDGVHVHKAPIKILARSKGKDKTIIVTDSVQIKGLEPGIHHFENRTVRIGEDGCGYLADGTLAGSSNRTNKLIQYMIEEAGVDEVTAFNAATINPCRRMGFNDIGLIKENYKADIVVLNDDYSINEVYLDGVKY